MNTPENAAEHVIMIPEHAGEGAGASSVLVDGGAVSLSADDAGEAGVVVDETRPKDATRELPEGAEKLDNGTIRLILSTPVVLRVKTQDGVQDVPYNEVTFHPLTGSQMLDAIGKGNAAKTTQALMVSSLRIVSTRADAIVRNMDARDFFKASKIIQVFTGSGQKTGQ
ncbi:hypothetical protein [Komagataeibacter xylinus]|uniref:hypothetical protein n=1 Tax=Komagataeibacter xylinus TaxID=28448 RepID=UPI00280AAE96|nr:hypothetical protein [Komagataeibacter xylinus]